MVKCQPIHNPKAMSIPSIAITLWIIKIKKIWLPMAKFWFIIRKIIKKIYSISQKLEIRLGKLKKIGLWKRKELLKILTINFKIDQESTFVTFAPRNVHPSKPWVGTNLEAIELIFRKFKMMKRWKRISWFRF